MLFPRWFIVTLIASVLVLAAVQPARAGTAERPVFERFLAKGPLDASTARARGISVGASAAGWTTLRVPPGLADALRTLPGARSIVRAPTCRLLLDAVAVDTRLSLFRTVGPGGVSGPAGAGVLVGIVDTGIDLTHADFRRADGTTRILSLWDQTSTGGSPPAAFSYGTEWSAAAIDAGGVVSPDDIGHGTHVAGIAAGNGRGGVAGLDADKYVGIAPEAALCVVKVDFSGPTGGSMADIIDGVAYVFAKASALGMPAVVNLSLGSHEGPHDGTFPADEMLEALAGPGRIIVAAAGNEGADRVHGRADVPAGGMSELTFRIPGYTANAGAGSDYVLLSAWHDRADPMSVTVVTPGGTTLGPVATGATYETADGHVSICLGDCTAPGLVPSEISVLVRDSLATAPPRSGTWKLRCTRVAAGGSGRVDAYVADQYLGAGAPWVVWVAGAVADGTIRSPATSDSVIAVGAHTTKPCWTNLDGGTSCAASSSTMGQLAFFSSRGPRRDGALKPDLSAPGLGVASTRSVAATFDSWETVPGGAHVVMLGTSMAAPAVAGAVALLLARPSWKTAGPTAVRDQLRGNARADGSTGSTPNDAWGYGKLDILSILSMTPTAVEATGAAPAARFALSAAAPNPFNPGTSATLALPRGGRVSVGVHDVAGRLVRNLVAGDYSTGRHRIAWDGRDDRGANVASGVYYLVVTVEGNRVTRRVTLLK